MKNSKTTKNNCNLLVMPPQISDEDISALFNGLLNVIKRKIELETKSEIININVNMEKLIKELKAKNAECTRLKNEIIYLKCQLNSAQTNDKFTNK